MEELLKKLDNIDASLALDTHQIIWQWMWSDKWCIKIPMDGEKCVKPSVGVRIVLDDGTYKLELELCGIRKTFALGNVCYTGFRVGIFTLEVCIDDLKFEDGKLDSFHIVVRVCINLFVIKKCRKILDIKVHFAHIDAVRAVAGVPRPWLDEVLAAASAVGSDFVYLETED